MGSYFAIDWLLLGFILISLMLFGTLFAVLVNRFFDQLQGYMSLMVAAGVLFTLAFAAFIFWPAAIIALICFTASGLPMIIGDVIRAINKRERLHQSLNEATDDQIKRIAIKLEEHDAP